MLTWWLGAVCSLWGEGNKRGVFALKNVWVWIL